MMSAVFLSLALAGGECRLTEASTMELPDGRLHLRDVVVGSDCAMPEQFGDLVVLSLPRTARIAHASRAALASLVRRRVPELQLAAPDEATAEIEFSRPASVAAAPVTCFALARAVQAGEALDQAVLATTPCAADQENLELDYDAAHGVVRARTAAADGAYVGRLLTLPERMIDANQPLTIQVTAGPVVVSRDVRAAQPAALGSNLFVRDGDGRVFAARSGAGDEDRP